MVGCASATSDDEYAPNAYAFPGAPNPEGFP